MDDLDLVVSNDLMSDDTHLLSSAIIPRRNRRCVSARFFDFVVVDMESDKKTSVDEFSCSRLCCCHIFSLATLNGM